MFSVGQIVFSKRGRDKGKPFIVLQVEDDYVYLADGVLRRLEKPKKKKAMHVQITKDVCLEIKEKLENNRHVEDADLKKALAAY